MVSSCSQTGTESIRFWRQVREVGWVCEGIRVVNGCVLRDPEHGVGGLTLSIACKSLNGGEGVVGNRKVDAQL